MMGSIAGGGGGVENKKIEAGGQGENKRTDILVS